MSETANNPGGPKRGVRPWHRLHLSTWVVLLLLATVLVLVIVPGESSWWGARRRHGWPWEYLQRTTHLPDMPVSALFGPEETAPGWLDRQGWAFTGDETVFSPWALVGDILAAILVLPVVGAAFEWRRRRYSHLWQCSLRELLLFVLAVAALLAWWQVQRKRFRQEQLALRQIGEHGFWPTYRGPKWLPKLVGHRRLGVFGWIGDHPFLWSPSEHPGVFQAITSVLLQRTEEDLKRVAPYLNRLPALESLCIHTPPGGDVTDDGLRAVSSLTSVRNLAVSASGVTDDGMIHLAKLGNLRTLMLSNSGITGAGLKHLAGLTQLEDLDISHTEVTDAGLAHLSALANLRALNLAGTRVTDYGLEPLKRLGNLSVLDLQSTLVTPEGVQRLQESLPKTSILADPRAPGSGIPGESPFAP